MRTSALYSAKKFIIFGRKKYDARSTVGSNNYIETIYIPDSFENNKKDTISSDVFKNTMENLDMIPFFIEQGGNNILEINWNMIENSLPTGKEICFIFGNEGIGIPTPILNLKTHFNSDIISIPQTGIMRSLNVSTAAAIVLWEYSKIKMKYII